MYYFFLCIVFFLDLGRSSNTNKIIYCDTIEENNYYDQKGGYVYTQIIFWKKFQVPGLNKVELHTVGFRMVGPNKKIERCGKYCKYVAYEEDIRDFLIEVRAPIYKESWTQIDPELMDKRSYWAKIGSEFDRPDIISGYIKFLKTKKVVEEFGEVKENAPTP